MTDEVLLISHAEHRRMGAVAEHDVNTLAESLGPESKIVSARTDEYGTRAVYIRMSEAVALHDFAYEDVDIDVLGGVAVLRCRYSQTATVHGKDWSGRFLITDVRVRRNGGWQVVAKHSSQPPHTSFDED